MSLATDFAIIDAQHAERTALYAEVKLLRILLTVASGRRATFLDRLKIAEVLKAHPRFADLVPSELLPS